MNTLRVAIFAAIADILNANRAIRPSFSGSLGVKITVESISNRALRLAGLSKLAILLFFLSAGALAQSSSAVQPAASRTKDSPIKTLDELRTSITEKLARPEVRRGQIGIKIVSLDTGSVIFEQNAEKYFMPASNMKNFTIAAALEKLTPDFEFVTSVYATAPPDNDGIVEGPVRVMGRGDVSISYSFFDGDYFKGIDRLADAVAAAGIKRIEGDLIGDETYFTGDAKPGGWEWDDLQFYYGAEVSSLPINDNAVAINVAPGPLGYGCTVRLTPPNLIFRVINKCITTPAGSKQTLRIVKELDRNIIEINGDMPFRGGAFNGFVSITHPAEMFTALLKQRLEAKGITVAGRPVAVNSKDMLPDGLSVEIAKIESPPLSVIAAKTLKPSQNMYTETILRVLGEKIGRNAAAIGGEAAAASEKTSQELGSFVVKSFLREIGIEDDAIIQYDGSGLSRHNLVTPAALVRLYAYMGTQSKFASVWRDSLTIGGVDGTLRNRFAGTRAAANIRGKTGTINQVSALSGYVTSASGERFAFSMLVNGVAESRTRVGLIDEVVVELANFGESDKQ